MTRTAFVFVAGLFSLPCRALPAEPEAGSFRAAKDAALEKVARIRGLPSRHPVPASTLDRDRLHERLLVLFEEEYPMEEARADSAAGALLGFFDGEIDLRAVLLGTLGEEVAGYYDPQTKRLYLIEAKPAPKRWWQKILGGGSGAGSAEFEAALAHELAHALADQHFDLFSLGRSVESDDDAALAAEALVEGDATLVMLLATSDPATREALLARSSGAVDRYLREFAPVLAALLSGRSYRDAPLLVRESLLFPYLGGLSLSLRLAKGGRWDLADRAFREPPASTEQVLHPEKYPLLGDSGGDPPLALELPPGGPFEESEGPGEGSPAWRLVKENCLGEFQTEVLLRPRLGRSRSAPAAAGWDGDLYRLYGREGVPGTACLVWVSTWDGPEDAAEFAAAAEAHFRSLDSAAGGSDGGGAPGFLLRVSGPDVTIARGVVPAAFLERVVAWAASFRRAEKAIPLRTFETPVRFGDEGLERTF